jgi:hypothetical protein
MLRVFKSGKYILPSLALNLFFATFLLGQMHDNVWTLGYGPSDDRFGGFNLSFKGDSMVFEIRPREMDMIRTVASVCDERGNLLFYTNGCSLNAYDDEPLMNGDSLNPGELFDIFLSSKLRFG